MTTAIAALSAPTPEPTRPRPRPRPTLGPAPPGKSSRSPAPGGAAELITELRLARLGRPRAPRSALYEQYQIGRAHV